MSDFSKLVSRCKATVHLVCNYHKSGYESVEQYLSYAGCNGEEAEIEPEIKQKMIELDTIVNLQFYPDTPIGFYKVWHYDVDLAIKKGLEILDSEQKP